MFVMTATVGVRRRNDRSLSSASTTMYWPRPSRALLPKADELAADHGRGVEPGALEHERHHRRGRGLAVGARDRDAGAQAHQLRQHLGARDHGDAAAVRVDDLGIVGPDRRRVHDHVGFADVPRVVAEADARRRASAAGR